MRVYNILLVLILYIITTSCGNSLTNEDFELPNGNSHIITVDKAKQNVMDFISKIGNKTRADYNNVNIKSVSIYSHRGATSRSIEENLLDSLFYIITFKDNKGFAIASIDDRQPNVFALVESGEFDINDTTANMGYHTFVESLINKQIEWRY